MDCKMKNRKKPEPVKCEICGRTTLKRPVSGIYICSICRKITSVDEYVHDLIN